MGRKGNQQDVAKADWLSHDGFSQSPNLHRIGNARAGLWGALTLPSHRAGADRFEFS